MNLNKAIIYSMNDHTYHVLVHSGYDLFPNDYTLLCITTDRDLAEKEVVLFNNMMNDLNTGLLGYVKEA